MRLPSLEFTPPAGSALIDSGNGANRLTTGREPIRLPESTKTLAVLFQFILPKPPPTLQNLDIEDLVDVVQAARKYKVYPVVSFGESRLL